MRDFRISTFIVSFITRGFCCFMVFHKGFYVNPDASCRKEKREGGKKIVIGIVRCTLYTILIGLFVWIVDFFRN
jgi:hypothetical protein